MSMPWQPPWQNNRHSMRRMSLRNIWSMVQVVS
jgi:hypothetical protein